MRGEVGTDVGRKRPGPRARAGSLQVISGEKSEERTEGGAKDNYHLSERRWGRFSRSFVLPRR